MKFTKTEPTENYPTGRFVSENEIWEIGLYPVMFGVRVRFGLVGKFWFTQDYCAADNTEFAGMLLSVVMSILEALPETITEREVSAMMPGYEVRPIYKDPCWDKLVELSTKLNKKEEKQNAN